MLSIGTCPIYLYDGSADMRKGFDGLGALASSSFPDRLLSGSLFVFVNRRRTQMKVLYWDSDGLAVWHKRLEAGTFKVSRSGRSELTRREFAMLLEGIEPRRLNRRFRAPERN
jgi:transposase